MQPHTHFAVIAILPTCDFTFLLFCQLVILSISPFHHFIVTSFCHFANFSSSYFPFSPFRLFAILFILPIFHFCHLARCRWRWGRSCCGTAPMKVSQTPTPHRYGRKAEKAQRREDRKAERQNEIKIAERQRGRMAEWQNGRMKKWQNGRSDTRGQSRRMAKC